MHYSAHLVFSRMRVGFFLSYCYLGCKWIPAVHCMLSERFRLVRVRFFPSSVFPRVIVLAPGLRAVPSVLCAWRLCAVLSVCLQKGWPLGLCAHEFPTGYSPPSETFLQCFAKNLKLPGKTRHWGFQVNMQGGAAERTQELKEEHLNPGSGHGTRAPRRQRPHGRDWGMPVVLVQREVGNSVGSAAELRGARLPLAPTHLAPLLFLLTGTPGSRLRHSCAF